ncbi:MAG: ankyrin repeat domain-containing protein, partial [Rickettsiales bacterium]|nr:ankyrin repeat domain-containing protein [Rickettsiales bacterium]
MNLRRLLFIVHCSLFIAMPSALLAASDFQTAAQLLSAAKNADIGQVQALVNNGADVNFVDNTGLSIVCTALMNKDVRAAQILQMYGADASRCDQQIKKYNNKQPKTESGGLFGGLSTAQSLALTAAGAAVVVGGVMLLGGGFGSGGGGAGASSGDRPNNNGNNNSGNGTATGTAALPYGPAMPNATSENTNYIANLNVYSPGTPGILADNFYLMNNTGAQNYLLIMHGYSPLARGYSGMRTLRNTATYAPLSLSNINLGPDAVQGGRPVNVALITANGVNAISDSSLGDKLTPWTTCNGTNCATVSAASNDMISSKYYNNKINRGTDNGSLSDDTTAEDSALLSMLDLSGSGTAINSTSATNDDNILAKIVGGNLSGYTNADYVGFMPNGQMTIFRTGGGTGFKAVPGGATAAFDSGTDTIGGVAVSYIGADGFYYVDTNADGAVDTAYLVAGAVATVAKQLGDIDYYNYKALYNAGILWAAGDGVSGGRSRPDIVANASVVSGLHLRDAKTLSWITSSANKTTDFFSWINEYYDRDTTDGAVAGTDAFPATDAYNFFMGLGTNFSPLVIFSTGAFETDSAWSGPTLEAGFENAAPLVFSNAEHLFASVVAVHINGTGTTCTGSGCSVSGYSPGGKIALSQWGTDTNGDSIADTFYKARSCGIAGRGAGGIDPWCFAAAGMTDEMAVASFAGAAGAVKGAFSYMDSKQIFALLALTADGAYLGSNGTGLPGSTPIAWTAGGLASYLQSMYELPAEAQFRVDGGEDYLTVFKEVFG